MKLPNRAFALSAFLLLIIDQVSKGMSRAALNEGNWFADTRAIGSISPYPWPGVFELKLIYNEGVAFGMLQGKGVFMTPVALLIAGFAAWFSAKNPGEKGLTHAALGLVTAGALGNLIDRVWLGRVTDMLWFRAIDFPVFNVADSCITVGVGMLLLAGFWGAKEPSNSTEQEGVSEPDFVESPQTLATAESAEIESTQPESTT